MKVTNLVINTFIQLQLLLCAERSLAVHPRNNNKMSCPDKFISNAVIPDVIDVAPQEEATVREIYALSCAPCYCIIRYARVTLQVEYRGGRAECGNVLTPTVVSSTANLLL